MTCEAGKLWLAQTTVCPQIRRRTLSSTIRAEYGVTTVSCCRHPFMISRALSDLLELIFSGWRAAAEGRILVELRREE